MGTVYSAPDARTSGLAARPSRSFWQATSNKSTPVRTTSSTYSMGEAAGGTISSSTRFLAWTVSSPQMTLSWSCVPRFIC